MFYCIINWYAFKFMRAFFFSKSGSSIKQHKRNNSDGLQLPVKPNSSVSCQDLSTLSVYTPGFTAAPNFSRRSTDSTANDADSLSSIDSANISEAVVSVKPEVDGIHILHTTISHASMAVCPETVLGDHIVSNHIIVTEVQRHFL
jgi:hypothetical protein